MQTSAHPIAVLNLPRRVKDLITYAKQVVSSMTGNTSFPSPAPSLTQLEADVAALDAAETAVLARTKGSTETRNAKLATVRADLEHEQSYVQQVANAANPSDAEAIIKSAGMSVRKKTSLSKGELAATQGAVSGSVTVSAKAVSHRACYEWQYSIDQKTWTSGPPTLQSRTELSGLTPATVYFFRFRAVTKAGEGDFSPIVSLLVA